MMINGCVVDIASTWPVQHGVVDRESLTSAVKKKFGILAIAHGLKITFQMAFLVQKSFQRMWLGSSWKKMYEIIHQNNYIFLVNMTRSIFTENL